MEVKCYEKSNIISYEMQPKILYYNYANCKAIEIKSGHCKTCYIGNKPIKIFDLNCIVPTYNSTYYHV